MSKPTAKEIAKNNVNDAMNWVVQEARAVKLMGTQLPRGSKLREALEALDKANNDLQGLNLPANEL